MAAGRLRFPVSAPHHIYRGYHSVPISCLPPQLVIRTVAEDAASPSDLKCFCPEITANIILTFPISLPGRIIGGKVVVPHSRPYMAYLKIKVTNKTGTFHSYCGGFLIQPDAVLSAAHCVRVEVTVILGAHNIHDEEESQQWISVRDWVFHPDYCPVTLHNDIVLMKVWPNTSFLPEGSPPNVKLISLPSSNERVRTGTKCEVAGWGWTSLYGSKTDVMREVELKVQNDKPCQKVFRNLFLKVGRACLTPLTPFMTQGDSGGPLVCNQKAHGIVSHGLESRLFPKVFTMASYFEPWIRQQLRRFALQELPASPSSQ
uniref:Peptidase S1 domain-containing protein n=1 Tax=Catharus ustulatus TaxID=91951 RepID=A0A8C3UXY3_CATUS